MDRSGKAREHREQGEESAHLSSNRCQISVVARARSLCRGLLYVGVVKNPRHKLRAVATHHSILNLIPATWNLTPVFSESAPGRGTRRRAFRAVPPDGVGRPLRLPAWPRCAR